MSKKPFLSLLGVAVMAITNGTAQPAIRIFFGNIATKANRATMLSLGSSMGSIGLISGFLLAGMFVDSNSSQRLLVVTLVSASLGLFFANSQKKIRQTTN